MENIIIMKTISRIAFCFLFSLIWTSCERYEVLNEQFTDIYGTWKNPDSFGGDWYGDVKKNADSSGGDGIVDVRLWEDKLIIVESSDKKFYGKFPNKLSKFADYQSFRKDGELHASGEVYIKEQYDDGIVIFFTYSSNSIGLVVITSLSADEMVIEIGPSIHYFVR